VKNSKDLNLELVLASDDGPEHLRQASLSKMCIPLHNNIALLKRIIGDHFQCVYEAKFQNQCFNQTLFAINSWVQDFQHHFSVKSNKIYSIFHKLISSKIIYPINCTLLSIALFTSKYNIGFYSNIIIPSTITFPKQRVRRLQTKSKTKFTMKMSSIWA
jgi:hypothetical protein